jgi:hypothetical protein
MTTKRLLQAISKAGLSAVKHDNNYYVTTSSRELSFIDQNGSAICVKVRRLSDVDDIQTDYFAGMFVDSIKWAMDCLARKD